MKKYHYVNQLKICMILLLISSMFCSAPISKHITDDRTEILNKCDERPLKENSISEYIVITKEDIVPVLQPFIEWEMVKGNQLTIIDIESIKEQYDAYDLSAKIRQFLRQSYEQLNNGLKNVLIIANTTDIPMRLIGQDKGYGPLYTDFYYSELTNTDEKSWDSDEDHLYGEREDNFDLIPEICVGRIPFSDPVLVSNVLNNTIYFEQNNDSSYKKNMLMMGAYFWNDTDNAAIMEAIRTMPQLSEWTAITLYEQNDEYYSEYDCDYPLGKDMVYEIWNKYPSSFVNWAGHGTPISAHMLGKNAASFISSFDLSEIKDAKPNIVFANSCNNANPLYSNIAYDCMKQNVIGFIGPSTTSQAASGWHHENDGSSQSFNYFFAERFLSGNATIAEAHQQALMEMNSRGLWYDPDFETFVWGTLYGIPDLSMNAIGIFPQLQIGEIVGGNGITFTICNIGEKEGQNITWDLSISGGKLIKKTFYSGEILSIGIDNSVQVFVPIFGLGLGYFSPQPIITFRASHLGIDTVITSFKVNILGPYIEII